MSYNDDGEVVHWATCDLMPVSSTDSALRCHRSGRKAASLGCWVQSSLAGRKSHRAQHRCVFFGCWAWLSRRPPAGVSDSQR